MSPVIPEEIFITHITLQRTTQATLNDRQRDPYAYTLPHIKVTRKQSIHIFTILIKN